MTAQITDVSLPSFIRSVWQKHGVGRRLSQGIRQIRIKWMGWLKC